MKSKKTTFILEIETVESLPSEKLTPAAKFLYSAMRRRWGYEKREMNVNSTTVMEELGMNPHSYRLAYNQLKKEGLVKREHRPGWGWSFIFPKLSEINLTQVTWGGNLGGYSGGVKLQTANPLVVRKEVQEKGKDRKIERKASKDIGEEQAVVEEVKEKVDGAAGDLADLFGSIDSEPHRQASKWIREMLETSQAEVQPWLPLAIENTKRQLEKEAVFSPTGWLRTLWANREQDIARAGFRKQAEQRRDEAPQSAPEKLKAFQAIAKEMGGLGANFANGHYSYTSLITPDFKPPRVEVTIDIGAGSGGATGGTAQLDVTNWTTDQFRQAFSAKRAKVTPMREPGMGTISDLIREEFPKAMPFG